MLAIISNKIDIEGCAGAAARFDVLAGSFLAKAEEIKDAIPPDVKESVLLGVFDLATIGVASVVQELGVLYAQANIFG